jgi:hypothetical protein
MIANTNASPTPWDALAGQYRLRPGNPVSLVGQRPVLLEGRLGRLLRGQRGEEVGRSLSSVFTLCAHAHRRTCELALAVAQGGPPILLPTEPPVALWLETARDHLRSIALDWPQRLPELGGASNLDWLSDCPLPLFSTQAPTDARSSIEKLDQLRQWLEQRILGQTIDKWLLDHCQPDALLDWCNAQAAYLPLARSLSACYPIANSLRPSTRCLHVLDEDATQQRQQLSQLARSMVDEADFVQHPSWLGQCAENGPWTRLRHRQDEAAIKHSAWTRMCARWIELVELAAASQQASGFSEVPLLSSGAMRLGEGQALAWCEMARGLLLHWVQLDAGGSVQDYRVLAPTEWNFHPQGALATAVAGLAPDDSVKANLLAAAFDPCVACTIELPEAK